VHSLDELAHVLRVAQSEADRKAGWAGWRAGRLMALTAVVAYTGMRKSEALHLRVEDLDFATGMVQLVSRSGFAYKTEASAQPLPLPPALVRILRAWVPRLGEFHPGIETDSGHQYHSVLNIRGRRPRTPDYLPPSVPRAVPKPGLATDPGWLIPNVYRTGPWVGGSPGHDPLDQLQALGRRAGVPGLTFQSLRHSWATHAESAWGLTDGQIQRILRHTNTRTQWHYRHAERNNLRAIAEGISFDGPEAAHGEDFDDEQ
jgi:integrase